MPEYLPANELLFLDAITHDAELRKALVDKNFDLVMQKLDDHHIQIKNKASVRKAIEAINWKDMGNLELRINDGIDQKMG